MVGVQVADSIALRGQEAFITSGGQRKGIPGNATPACSSSRNEQFSSGPMKGDASSGRWATILVYHRLS